MTPDALVSISLGTVVGRLADRPVHIHRVVIGCLGQVVDPVEELDRTEGWVAEGAGGVGHDGA